MRVTGVELNLADDTFKLAHLLACGLLAHHEEVRPRPRLVNCPGTVHAGDLLFTLLIYCSPRRNVHERVCRRDGHLRHDAVTAVRAT
jgi:hypothetical protein